MKHPFPLLFVQFITFTRSLVIFHLWWIHPRRMASVFLLSTNDLHYESARDRFYTLHYHYDCCAHPAVYRRESFISADILLFCIFKGRWINFILFNFTENPLRFCFSVKDCIHHCMEPGACSMKPKHHVANTTVHDRLCLSVHNIHATSRPKSKA